jgi:hypothetical protein
MSGLDNMEPEMDRQEPAQSDVIGTHGEADREGAMAKADLFKLANYAHKLYQQIEDEDQLEAWVQAKITKAADYIASVYHYLEYEMKFSEYGHHLDNSDTLSEDQKSVLKARLNEAKEKMKELKKTQAEKIKEKKVDEATGFRASGNKKGGVEKSSRKHYFIKLEKDGATKGMTMVADDGESQQEVRDRAARDARSGGWTVASIRVKDDIDETSDQDVHEAKSKMADKDYDGDGKVETGKDEYLGSRIAAAKKAGKLKEGQKCNECGMIMEKCACMHESAEKTMSRAAKGMMKYGKEGMKALAKAGREGKDLDTVRDKYNKYDESTKPSAGLSKAEKSAVVKKAKAGEDIGKPGKGFAKLAKKAGGGEKGEKIAAAAMWKNMKETTAYMAEKKAMEKKTKEARDEMADEGNEFSGALAQARKQHKDSFKVDGKTYPVNESMDVDRIRELTKRLLG